MEEHWQIDPSKMGSMSGRSFVQCGSPSMLTKGQHSRDLHNLGHTTTTFIHLAVVR